MVGWLLVLMLSFTVSNIELILDPPATRARVQGAPSSIKRLICLGAIIGLVANPTSCGTPAFLRRSSSAIHSWGIYSLHATGGLAFPHASDTFTAT